MFIRRNHDAEKRVTSVSCNRTMRSANADSVTPKMHCVSYTPAPCPINHRTGGTGLPVPSSRRWDKGFQDSDGSKAARCPYTVIYQSSTTRPRDRRSPRMYPWKTTGSSKTSLSRSIVYHCQQLIRKNLESRILTLRVQRRVCEIRMNFRSPGNFRKGSKKILNTLRKKYFDTYLCGI